MTNGLQKILTELKADKPRIDYMLGIVETLIEMQGTYTALGQIKDKVVSMGGGEIVSIPREFVPEPKDEGAILTAQTKARIDAVKALADKSTEIA